MVYVVIATGGMACFTVSAPELLVFNVTFYPFILLRLGENWRLKRRVTRMSGVYCFL
jgi:hypothetical protein